MLTITRTDKTYCPATVLRVLLQDQPAGMAAMISDAPVTASLLFCAAAPWPAARRRGHRRVVCTPAGHLFDRLSMGVALAGVSLPVFFTGLIALELFSYKWALFPDVHFVGITQNPF